MWEDAYSVAVETSKELSLPFHVTNTFAHQRFMSSSYLSLKNLEESLEVYIETFKDHENRLDVGYKLYGQDFAVDLLGLLDLLWPLVILMLQSQTQWCPGWKFESYIPAVQDQLTTFIAEMDEDIPSSSVSPRLNKHLADIMEKKYGKCELVEGWLVVEEVAGKPVEWQAREPQECMEELRILATDMKAELDRRFATSYPKLNTMLHKCLDFGVLFAGLCGVRTDGIHPVNKQAYSVLGAAEFRKCVEFVSQLPHVQEKNMELSSLLSSAVFWLLKSALMDVVWGKLFSSHFSNFFRQVEKVVEKPGAALRRHVLLGDIAIPFGESTTQVVEFSKSVPTTFSLVELFRVQLSGGKTIEVVLQEDAIILGWPCLLFDNACMLKQGLKQLLSLFIVLLKSSPEMEGRQSLDVLASRSKIDWCLPPVMQCDSALTELAQL